MAKGSLKLSTADVRRALVRHQFAPTDLPGVFERQRSVQFDPLSPVGCNHDLVLQARVKNYRIGDWHKAAYKKRLIYDGWDKMACLIGFEGWPLRRVFYEWQRGWVNRVVEEHPEAIEAVLRELETRGPLLPKDFDFQHRRADWKTSWFGPSVTKQALRYLWHTGKVMTWDRKGSHHVYNLTERTVPPQYLDLPMPSDEEAIRELVGERHRGVGLIRPAASLEMWGSATVAARKRQGIEALLSQDRLVPVDVEGMVAHATPEFLTLLDEPALKPQVRFLGPLDHLMWDRKMVGQVFGFDYLWEVYKPEHQRQWGYYVLPVMHGDRFVARAEFWCRKGVLEVRAWHWEPGQPKRGFWTEYEKAIKRFMSYCSASEIVAASGVDPRVVEAVSAGP